MRYKKLYTRQLMKFNKYPFAIIEVKYVQLGGYCIERSIPYKKWRQITETFF